MKTGLPYRPGPVGETFGARSDPAPALGSAGSLMTRRRPPVYTSLQQRG